MSISTRRAAWFAAGVLPWSGVDTLQVAATTGGQPLERLVLVVVAFYLLAALALSLCAAPFLSRAEPLYSAAIEFATALLVPGGALAGLKPGSGWVGRNLLARSDAVVPAYAELLREGGIEIYMATDGKRKYIEFIDGMGAPVRQEIFDLVADPREQAPLVAAPREPLREELSRRRDAARSAALAPDATVIDEDAEERLRALGYLN